MMAGNLLGFYTKLIQCHSPLEDTADAWELPRLTDRMRVQSQEPTDPYELSCGLEPPTWYEFVR